MSGASTAGLLAFLAPWWKAALILLAGGWCVLMFRRPPVRSRREGAEEPEPSYEAASITGHQHNLVLEREIEAALAQVRRLAAERFTVLQVAVAPDLSVRADPEALRRALTTVLRVAIDRAEGGHVLVAASRHGTRVRIAIADDGPATLREVQEAALRDAQEVLALQGGSLEVEVLAGLGSTVAIRLAESLPNRPDSARPALKAAPAAAESLSPTASPALAATIPAPPRLPG